MEVGNRIRRERQRLGISQEELSRRAYVSRPTLSHWETGRTLPDAQSLLVLSEIFGTSIDELVKGDVAEMEEIVDREARVAIGRTLALACVAVGAGVCLVAVSFTARYLVGSVAFYSMTLLSMVMGFTVMHGRARGPYPLHQPPGCLPSWLRASAPLRKRSCFVSDWPTRSRAMACATHTLALY